MSSSFERRAFSDQLSIETPEQVALEFPVAGIGSRFVALALDHLLQAGALILLFLSVFAVLAFSGNHKSGQTLSSKWFLAVATLVVFLIWWGYFALFEAFWHGQTPGKRVMKLRVIKDSGRQITLFEAMARNLMRFADLLPSLYLAGAITMLCNRRNQRLGDLAAGTLVIHEQSESQPLLWTGQAQRAQTNSTGESRRLFPPDAVARLGSRDLAVIEAFFARALDLPLPTRATMAQRIVEQMTDRMHVAAPVEINPERVLGELAVQLRGQGRRLR